MPTASLKESPFSQNVLHHLAKPHFASCSEETVRTIHRRTKSHHGAALRILGHAAEYLSARPFAVESPDAGDLKAAHILMRLSREVFDDYASSTRRHHPVADWIMDQAVRIYGAA